MLEHLTMPPYSVFPTGGWEHAGGVVEEGGGGGRDGGMGVGAGWCRAAARELGRYVIYFSNIAVMLQIAPRYSSIDRPQLLANIHSFSPLLTPPLGSTRFAGTSVRCGHAGPPLHVCDAMQPSFPCGAN
jgi:hypothetical protein